MNDKYIGKKYGKWIVLSFSHINKYESYYYICKCDCGTQRAVRIENLKNGTSKACGCIKKNPNADLKTRLFDQVEKTETCWIWNGGLSNGYGCLHYKGHTIRTHRASWLIHFGKVPRGKVVCHSCDNPKCVNPEHLWIGTIKDNAIDCRNKGRNFVNRGVANHLTKLNDDLVRELRNDHKKHGSIKKIADKYSIDKSTAFRIIKRETWKHVI